MWQETEATNQELYECAVLKAPPPSPVKPSDDCVCLVAQMGPSLCGPMECSPPGSSVHGIFSRQEHWSGVPFPPPGDLPDPGIEPRFPVSPPVAGRFFTTSATWEARPHVRPQILTHFLLHFCVRPCGHSCINTCVYKTTVKSCPVSRCLL